MLEVHCEAPVFIPGIVEGVYSDMGNNHAEPRSERLRQLRNALQSSRRELGFTLKDVADRTQATVSVSQLSRIERGDIESPSFLDVAAVASALGFTGNDLFRVLGLTTVDEVAADPVLREVMGEIMRMPPADRQAFTTVLRLALIGYRNGETDE